MQDRQREIYKVTLVGSVGNALLVAFKFIAGFAGHSAAMLADAVHSLSDFITDIMVLVFVRLANKPEDEDHDYGHGKYETLATALISLLLLAVGLGILWEGLTAIWAFFHGVTLPRPGNIALYAALASIVVKELLYQYSVYVGKKIHSQVVIANAWHHRSDALSSIGTGVGIGGAILLGDKWTVLDPLAAVVVSFFILKVAYSLTLSSLGELMDKSLPADVEQQIIAIVEAQPEVGQPHNLRTRRVGNRAAVEMHVRMDGQMTVEHSHSITREIEHSLRELLGPGTFISIHVEPKPRK